MEDHSRPDPDALLQRIASDERLARRGKLRVFLGMSAGVGKTYAMLRSAHARQNEGLNVLVALVETHGRKETEALTQSLKLLPKKKIAYRGVELEEMDLDAVLKAKPDIVVVDELAHTNAPGSRHPKRYQDVLEILAAGIDVYTAINVQHLESRKDIVEKITGVVVRETVPDSIIEIAEQIEVIDITPHDLLKRLKEGKVYLDEAAKRAADHFFKVDSLTALREMALRFTAEKVDQELQSYHRLRGASEPWKSNERLMVAISHSPYSERLVRTTRRLAYNLEAPWIAVYVDTGLKLSADDRSQLAKTINLARELNAEVISTNDVDVAQALKRLARQKNITQLIIGRPTKRPVMDKLEGGTLLDKLVRENWETDVHVIRHENEPANKHARRSSFFERLNFTSGFNSYWNTLWLIIGLGFLSGLLEPSLGYQAVGFIFLVGVLIVGRIAGMGPTLFAALLSAISWNFFFIPPRFTVAISRPEDFILCLTFFVVAVITGTLTNRVRAHELLIREREDRTNLLYEILKDISSSQGRDEFVERVVRRVAQVFKGECGVLLGKRQFAMTLTEKESAVAEWVLVNRSSAGWSTQTLSDSSALFIPLTGDRETNGVFIYRPQKYEKLSLDQETLLFSICRQLGLSLERHSVEERLAEAQVLKQSEHLHQTLLNSISHEMRTPLTAIMGSASALADESLEKSGDLRKELSQEIVDAGERLNRVIENLLDMSRLSSGKLSLALEWHTVEDLVGVTARRLSRALAQHDVKIQLPAKLPLVHIDFKLMEHALANLLMNAVAHTPTGSAIVISATVSGEREHEMVEVVVQDSGAGIPNNSLPHIFEKFYRAPEAPKGGTGLGLSIVKSIVELHGATVRVENRSGARFTLAFPVAGAPVLPEGMEP